MKVEKFLYIKSLDQLYNILNENSNLSESSPLFLSFIDYMYEYYEGCKCMEETNLNLAIDEYNKISSNSDIKMHLMTYFNCDGIRFSKL